jgi:hypothetical protein
LEALPEDAESPSLCLPDLSIQFLAAIMPPSNLHNTGGNNIIATKYGANYEQF